MTSKEKAIQLVEKMMLYSYEKIDNENNTKYIVNNKIKKEQAKQCAFIAVDEILNVRFFLKLIPLQDVKYWQQVKQEIYLL